MSLYATFISTNEVSLPDPEILVMAPRQKRMQWCCVWRCVLAVCLFVYIAQLFCDHCFLLS